MDIIVIIIPTVVDSIDITVITVVMQLNMASCSVANPLQVIWIVCSPWSI